MAHIGSRLQGQKGTYRLTASLGAGLTSLVFLAEVEPTTEAIPSPVAIKVLRQDADQQTRKAFYDEAAHLGAVHYALDQWLQRNTAKNDLGLAPASPPGYYEVFPLGDTAPPAGVPGVETPDSGVQETFLVMELMQGQRVEHLLEERGSFVEVDAIRFGLQLFGLFRLLHEEVNRTYSDFKFENLWWEAQTRRLRVTDWNVLSERNGLENVLTDLERGGLALLRVLTGSTLQRGRRLDQQPNWQALSKGAQQILAKLLAPERSARYQAAHEVCQDLERLLRDWERDPRRLLAQAEALLEGLSSAVARLPDQAKTLQAPKQNIQEIETLLDLLRRRRDRAEKGATGGGVWPGEIDAVLDALSASLARYIPTPDQMLHTVRQLLEGGSASVALDVLREGVDAFPDDIRVHRWLAAAEALISGSAADDKARRTLLQAVEQLDGGNYPDAQANLDAMGAPTAQIGQLYPFGGIMALRLNCDLHLRMQNALALEESASELARAQQAVCEVESLLDKLPGDSPYAQSIRKEFAEQLPALRQSLAEKERDQRAAQWMNTLQELAAGGRWSEGLHEIEGYWHEYAGYPGAADRVLDFGAACLGSGQPAIARQVFGVGAKEAARRDDFVLGWQVARINGWENTSALATVQIEELNDVAAHVRRLLPMAFEEGEQGLKPARPEWLSKLGGSLIEWLRRVPEAKELRRELELALQGEPVARLERQAARLFEDTAGDTYQQQQIAKRLLGQSKLVTLVLQAIATSKPAERRRVVEWLAGFLDSESRLALVQKLLEGNLPSVLPQVLNGLPLEQRIRALVAVLEADEQNLLEPMIEKMAGLLGARPQAERGRLIQPLLEQGGSEALRQAFASRPLQERSDLVKNLLREQGTAESLAAVGELLEDLGDRRVAALDEINELTNRLVRLLLGLPDDDTARALREKAARLQNRYAAIPGRPAVDLRLAEMFDFADKAVLAVDLIEYELAHTGGNAEARRRNLLTLEALKGGAARLLEKYGETGGRTPQTTADREASSPASQPLDIVPATMKPPETPIDQSASDQKDALAEGLAAEEIAVSVEQAPASEQVAAQESTLPEDAVSAGQAPADEQVAAQAPTLPEAAPIIASAKAVIKEAPSSPADGRSMGSEAGAVAVLMAGIVVPESTASPEQSPVAASSAGGQAKNEPDPWQAVRAILAAGDPKAWLELTVSEDHGRWPADLRAQVQAKAELAHGYREKLTRLQEALTRDPGQVQEELNKWLAGHPVSTCYDAQKYQWTPTVDLVNKVARIADDSRRAQECLAKAEEAWRAGLTSAVQQHVREGLRQEKAHVDVRHRLEELGRRLGQGQSPPRAPAAAHGPADQEAALDAALKEVLPGCGSIAEMRQRVLELARSAQDPDLASLLKARAEMLLPWADLETRADQIIRQLDGKPAGSIFQSLFADQLAALDRDSGDPKWRPFLEYGAAAFESMRKAFTTLAGQPAGRPAAQQTAR